MGNETSFEEIDPVHYYPLDVRVLVKGQTFTVEELEGILHVPITDTLWWRKVLTLKQWICDERVTLGLPYLTLTQQGWHGGLHVCTDAEAAVYNVRRMEHGKRTVNKAFRGKVAVDRTQLTESEQREHDSSLNRMAMVISAMRSASRKSPEIPAPNRVTPPMIETPKDPI